MIGISWNCRGLGNPRTVLALCEINKSRKPDFIFLIETLVHSAQVEKLKSKLGFEGAFYVDRVGRGGGLTFLWRKTGMFSLLSYSQSHIDMEVSEEDGLRWRVTGFYGFPDRSQ